MQPQAWVELATNPVATADGTALASSTSLTAISPSASTNPAYTIPANRLFPGAAIRVRGYGRVSTTGTPTLLLGVYSGGAGGTALGTTGAITTTSGVTNVPWFLEALIVCRTIGSSGTLFTQGLVTGISGTAGVSAVPIPASAPAAVTVDTTTAKTLDLCAQWGTNSASNTITQHLWIVEGLNVSLV